MMSNFKKTNVLKFVLVTSFFAIILFFQFRLELLADYPYDDEYFSLLSGLGIIDYLKTSPYIRLLSFFSIFFNSFESLHTCNFIMAHLTLCLGFFFYHSRKSINLATNLFFTAMLALNPLNIVLSRKMHFWGAALFFIVIGIGTYLKGNVRNWFFFFALLFLGFFRVEFFFSAIFTLAYILCYKQSIKKIIISSVFIILLLLVTVAFILNTMFGMQELLDGASYNYLSSNDGNLLKAILSIITQAKENMSAYFLASIDILFSTFFLYSLFLINGFVLLFFMSCSVKKNVIHFYESWKKDFFIFYFPACLALMSIRFLDAYIIMFYVLLLSAMSFLLNSRENKYFQYFVFIIVLPVFWLNISNFSENFKPKLMYRRMYHGQVERYLHSVVKGLPEGPVENPYKILSYEQLDKVYPDKGHQFFIFRNLKEMCLKGNVHFDVVIIHHVGDKDLMQKCVIPKLIDHHKAELTPFAAVYVSKRVLSRSE